VTKGRDYLLDTNILGPLAELKADGSSPESQMFRKHWEARGDAKFFLCPITIGEVEYGLRVGPYNQEEKQDIARKTVSAFPLLDINADVARNHYAVLRARLFDLCSPREKKRGHYNRRIEEWKDPTTAKTLQIQENDLWIASVAIAHNLILVTRDKMEAIKRVAGTDLLIEHWL